jgi:hypothetical protein
MGRGRQKAKDAKIARQLKYSTAGSDLKALERELISGGSAVDDDAADDELDDGYEDRWSDDD